MEEANAFAKVAAKLNLAAGIIFVVSIFILAWAYNEMDKEIQRQSFQRAIVEDNAQYLQQLLIMERQAYCHNNHRVNNYGRPRY